VVISDYNTPVMYLDPSGNVALVDDFVFGFAAYMLLTIAVIVVSYIAVETGMLNDFGNFLYESKNKIDNAITEMFMSLSISIAGLYNNVLASSKKSAKERSTQHPSYVNRGMIDKTLDAHQNATNMMNNKWGKGNWGKGPGSDYNQIVKWIVRGELLKEILIRVYNNEADEKEYYLIYDYFGVWNYENL